MDGYGEEWDIQWCFECGIFVIVYGMLWYEMNSGIDVVWRE